MYAICIESSHNRGMGHLFRSLNLIEQLHANGENYILLVNNDERAISILTERKIRYEIVDLLDYHSNWESAVIKKYGVDIWINDRLDTNREHTKNIPCEVKLVTFDDRGDGAENADVNIAALAFEHIDQLKGKKVYTGTKYLILNNEINQYKRLRKKIEKIIVTLGGSDTYGVTIMVIEILKKLDLSASIVIGPSFEHETDLCRIIDERFSMRKNLPSLIKEFQEYDLAITGGGITPFEANASGLPCIIIANELHEIEIAKYLEGLGSSLFAGYYKNIKFEKFTENIELEKMSKSGMENITSEGAATICSILRGLKL